MPATAKGGFAETFDESPLPGLDSEALDFKVASVSFPDRGKLGKAEWQTLRLLEPQGRRLVPTVGGLLWFGKNPEARSPDAWIQCGRLPRSLSSTASNSALQIPTFVTRQD